jgi:hypothetical protein
MIKIIAVAAMIAVALVTAKQQRAMERSGILSKCSIVATPVGEEGEWRSCTQGILTGFPSLEMDSCERVGRSPGHEFWRCPVPLTVSRVP